MGRDILPPASRESCAPNGLMSLAPRRVAQCAFTLLARAPTCRLQHIRFAEIVRGFLLWHYCQPGVQLDNPPTQSTKYMQVSVGVLESA